MERKREREKRRREKERGREGRGSCQLGINSFAASQDYGLKTLRVAGTWTMGVDDGWGLDERVDGRMKGWMNRWMDG